MNIRTAKPEDAAAIARVHVTTWQATYRGIVPQPYLDALDQADFANRWTDWLHGEASIPICVAEVNQSLIGFAAGGPIRKPTSNCDAELYAIYLLPEMHHQGIGRKLISHIEQALIEGNRRQILAWVLRDNPATAFYTKLGGRIVAEDTVEIGGISLPELAYAWSLTPGAASVETKAAEAGARIEP